MTGAHCGRSTAPPALLGNFGCARDLHHSVNGTRKLYSWASLRAI